MTRFAIDPRRSTVWIEARSSLHPIHGEATGLGGYLEVGLADGRLDLSAPAEMHIELPVEELRSGNALQDRELLRRVDADRYRKITGDARKVQEADGDGRYRVSGDVSFHGATRTIDGDVRVSAPDDRTLVVEGEQMFDIRDFDLKPPKVLMFRVEPEVRVRIQVTAERAD
ncbi:MAG TPA: YceI family protein [Mycobacteriales bacterium]|jgi:polyisoprenoid-binding protein YceI|nr:YceI-like domain [Mycobacterium sp.]